MHFRQFFKKDGFAGVIWVKGKVNKVPILAPFLSQPLTFVGFEFMILLMEEILHQLIGIVYPFIPGGAGFLPSTVCYPPFKVRRYSLEV